MREDSGAERLTTIDRRLVRDMDDNGIVSASDGDPFQQSLRAGRLQKLGQLGLADNLEAGRWRLADGIEDTLRRMGERGDIIRTMQRELTARRIEHGCRSFVETKAGDRVDGKLSRTIEMTSGRHVLIERSRDFTLVSWRPIFERQVGRSVSGIMRGDGINWTIGRGRSGPSIGEGGRFPTGRFADGEGGHSGINLG